MKAIRLHDKEEIRAFFSTNVPLHIYSIGDLDDFFWPDTSWYAWKEKDDLNAVVLLYTATSLPVLLALTEESTLTKILLESITDLLPARFYAHLSTGLEDVFEEGHKVVSHGRHYKMALRDKTRWDTVDTAQAIPLTPTDLKDLQRLYAQSYSGNWFEPRMLETNQYFGIRGPRGLISVAGVHVYSPTYRVAALGNITTHPDFRGKGLGTAVTAKLCKSLIESVDHIGLNVKVDNEEAIRCYRKLGFEVIANYEEQMVELCQNP